jgi:hypothetical protein
MWVIDALHISPASAVGAQYISTPIFMVQNRFNERLKSSNWKGKGIKE